MRGIHNTAETRRQLRLDVQKEVVDCNAEIVKDFGKVAEVRLLLLLERLGPESLIRMAIIAIETDRNGGLNT